MTHHAPVAAENDLSGEALLRQGRFAAAEHAFRVRLDYNAADVEALLGLSAALRRLKRHGEARKALVSAAQLRPVEPSRFANSTQAILRPRCIEASNYCATRRAPGAFRTKFKGGHFSVTHLLGIDRKRLVTVNLVNEDPSPLIAAGKAGLLLNTMACADRSRSSLSALSTYLEQRPDLPVINHPNRVLRTARDENFRRLGTIAGAQFPRTLRLTMKGNETQFLAALSSAAIDLPIIVRATGRQTGRQMFLCRDLAAVRTTFNTLKRCKEVYVIAYRDCRAPNALFHKARVFFIDGQLYPVAWLSSDGWQIHSSDRYQVMSADPSSQADEQRYLADPEGTCGRLAWRALHEVQDRLGLDFAGVDFTILPDGALFIFEANAAMRHNFDHADNFPYTRPYLEAVTAGFSQMVSNRAGCSA